MTMTYKEDRFYRDYHNYNLEKKDGFSCEFPINSTVFTYGFLRLSPRYVKAYAWNWDIAPYDYKNLDWIALLHLNNNILNEEEVELKQNIEKITGKVWIKGKCYEKGIHRVSAKKAVTVNALCQIGEKNLLPNHCIEESDWKDTENKHKLHATKRPDLGSAILIYLSDEVLNALEEEFAVTQFCARMGGSIEKSESVKVELIYYVENQVPCLDMKINEYNPYRGTVLVNEKEIDSELCIEIEKRFREAHIVTSVEPAKDNEVLWKKPFDWMEVPKKDENPDNYDEEKIRKMISLVECLKERSAVYMWIGHKKGRLSDLYLYIGIVGVRGNKGNTVGKRILDQERTKGIAHQNNIIIDRIRLSAIAECGKNVSMDEVLQTVEMQCINNFSSIFGYAASSTPIEDTIHYLFNGVFDKEKGCTIQLLNNKKRYHNDR